MSKTKTAAYNTVFGLFKGDLKVEYIPKILAMAAIYCDIFEIPDIDENKPQVQGEPKKRGPKKGWKKEKVGLAKNGFVVSKYKDDMVVSKFDTAMTGNYHLFGDRAKSIVEGISREVKLLPIVVSRILRANGRSRKDYNNQLHVYMPNNSPFGNVGNLEKGDINV
jgi:hypothetical protein